VQTLRNYYVQFLCIEDYYVQSLSVEEYYVHSLLPWNVLRVKSDLMGVFLVYIYW